MRYRVRCGDCACSLSRRVVGLVRIARLVTRHRLDTGCKGTGLLVLPIRKKVA